MAIHQLSDESGNFSPAQIRDKLIFGDIITAQFPDGSRERLWSRPHGEYIGPPYQVSAVVIPVSGSAQLEILRWYVNRLKNGD